MRLQPMLFETRNMFGGLGWLDAPRFRPPVGHDHYSQPRRTVQQHAQRESDLISKPSTSYPENFWEPVSAREAAELKQRELSKHDKQSRTRVIPVIHLTKRADDVETISSSDEDCLLCCSDDDCRSSRTYQNKSNNGLPVRSRRRNRSKSYTSDTRQYFIDVDTDDIVIDSDSDIEESTGTNRKPSHSSHTKKKSLLEKQNGKTLCSNYNHDRKISGRSCQMLESPENNDNFENEMKERRDQSLMQKTNSADKDKISFSSKEEELQYRDLVEFFSCDSNGSKLDAATSRSPCGNIVDTPSYPAYGIIQKIISKDGWQVDYIKGDGNCFFRALSKVIYGSESCHEELRQAVIDLMEKHPRKFEQFIDSGSVHDHIIAMRKPGTWATQAEIYVAATLLQRDIYVLSPDHTGECYRWLLFSPRFKNPEIGVYDSCFITLCHTNANHYDRIAPQGGECNCKLQPPQLLGLTTEVDLTESSDSIV